MIPTGAHCAEFMDEGSEYFRQLAGFGHALDNTLAEEVGDFGRERQLENDGQRSAWGRSREYAPDLFAARSGDGGHKDDQKKYTFIFRPRSQSRKEPRKRGPVDQKE